MKTRLRKEREFAQREQEFLELARRMIVEQGYAGLLMDRLAEATEYSKGTIYQHFSSKEDVVVALACQSLCQRAELLERALHYAGRTRERMTAVAVADEMFFRLHPHHYHCEQVIKWAALEQRASAERTGRLHELERRCFGSVLRVVEEGVAAGDLTISPPLTPAAICAGGLALYNGTYSTSQNFLPLLSHYGVSDPLAGLRRLTQALLDGLGWRPLSGEWDYSRTYQTIEQDVFAEECDRVGLSTPR